MRFARFRMLPSAAGSLAVALTALNLQIVRAADPGDSAPAKQAENEEDAAPKLSPEHEAVLTKLLKKFGEVKAKHLRAHMKTEAEDVVKATGLGADGAKALTAAADEAADRAADEWIVGVKKSFMKHMDAIPEGAWDQIAGEEAHADDMVEQPNPEIEPIDPASNQAWTDALKRTLTPEQAAAWDKVLAQRLKEIKDEFASQIEPLSEENRERFQQQIAAEADGVVQKLALPDDRAAKVKALANVALDKAMDAFRKRIVAQIRAMEPTTRQRMRNQPGLLAFLARADFPERLAAWTEGLAGILSADEMKRWQESEKSLDDDVRKMLKASVDKVRKQYADEFHEQVGRLTKKLALPKDRADQVSVLAESAVEKTMDALQKRAEKQLLGMTVGQRRVEVDRGNFTIPRRQEDDPERQPVWKAGLAKLLSAEELKLWQASEKELDAEANDFLKSMAEGVQDQVQKGILGQVDVIAATLSLPKEKIDQLNSLADSAVKKAMEAWRAQAEKYLLSLKSEQRRRVIRQGNFYMPPKPNDRPDQQAVWKDGFAKLLSADELKRWEASQADAAQRRLRAMGRILVTELDQKVALTSPQREQLQPLAERLLKDDPELFGPGGFDNNYRNVSTEIFTNAAGKAKDDDLKPLIDDIQRKRWRAACDPSNAEFDQHEMPAAVQPDKTAKANQKTATRATEPEDLEAVISKCLDERAAMERRKLLETMYLKAEDAARVAGLSGEAADQLQVAARGAAEEALGSWKEEIQYARDQMRGDLTPEDVEQRFASMQHYQWYRRGMPSADNDSIWQTAVKTILTPPQADAWKKAVEDRKGFRIAAIAAAVIAEFDHNLSLTADQCGKLEPLVTTVVKDYDQDIGGYFGGSGSRRSWYLLSYAQFIPIVGVPEKDLKAILSAAQWKNWSESNQYGNSMSYWENLQRNHKMRMQQN